MNRTTHDPNELDELRRGAEAVLDDSRHRGTSELQLSMSRAFCRTLYDEAPIGYAVLDARGCILDANATLGRWLDCDPAWLTGRPLSLLMSQAEADAFRPQLRAALGGAVHRTCEAGLCQASGEILPTRLDLSPIPRAAAKGRVLAAILDLTELRHTERGARSSRTQAETLFDTTLDGIVTLDVGGRIEATNAAAQRMFGYDEAELRGRSAKVLLPETTLDLPTTGRDDTRGCPEDDDGEPILTRGRRRDGTEVPLELELGCWQGPDGPKLTVRMRDVTERRETELRLEESETRLREIVTHVGAVLYVGEQGGRLSYVSPAYEAIWGRSASSATESARGWVDTIDPRDEPAVDDARQRLTRGDPVEVEYRISRPDGETRWIRDHASPIRHAGSPTRRYVGVARDITDQQLLEDELRQASKMEAVNTLAAGIAHDFRNLLHGIAGCVMVAERHLHDRERVRTHLVQIRDATRRGSALTDQLTTFSRRRDDDAPHPIVVDKLIEETAPLLMRLMGEQIRVVLQLNAPGASVCADPVQIERILMNLAGNACDAMPNGGTLVIRTEMVTVDERHSRPYAGGVAGRCVRIDVRDTGIGMDDATRARIFEPFFTTKEFGKGTGLGLAAVFGITRELGGHVAVDSTPSVGTTFTFWLPRSFTANRREATGPHEMPVISSTVLLVEDDRLVRMAIRGDLEALGMHVVEARDPRHALTLVELMQPPPGLLITDVMMPDMTGPRLADELCARIPGLRVLLVSAHAAEDLIERGTMRAGTPFLRKPFESKALGRRVLEVLDASASAPEHTPTPTMASRTILLVDDNEHGRDALKMLLEDEGTTVLDAADPNEALRLVDAWSGSIDLLITDINLPHMRGDVLASRCRALRRGRLEVLYVSGGPPPEDLDPTAPFVFKPIEFDRLLQRIRDVLDRGDRA